MTGSFIIALLVMALAWGLGAVVGVDGLPNLVFNLVVLMLLGRLGMLIVRKVRGWPSGLAKARRRRARKRSARKGEQSDPRLGQSLADRVEAARAGVTVADLQRRYVIRADSSMVAWGYYPTPNDRLRFTQKVNDAMVQR